MSVPDMYLQQGIAHIQRILRFCTLTTFATGFLIRTTLELMKMEIGINGSVLEQDYKRYGLLVTKSWIQDSWQFLSTNKMGISDDLPDLPLRRQGDRYLTQAFAEAGAKGALLKRLKSCRMYLNVTTLADITTGDGSTITPLAWNGELDVTRPKYWEWPNQGQPRDSTWTNWRKYLKIAFDLNQRKQLPLDLGHWNDPQTFAEWKWFYHPPSDMLFQKRASMWRKYGPTVHTRRSRRPRCKYTFSEIVETSPPGLLLATVQSFEGFFRITGAAAYIPPPAGTGPSQPGRSDHFPPQ